MIPPKLPQLPPKPPAPVVLDPARTLLPGAETHPSPNAPTRTTPDATGRPPVGMSSEGDHFVRGDHSERRGPPAAHPGDGASIIVDRRRGLWAAPTSAGERLHPEYKRLLSRIQNMPTTSLYHSTFDSKHPFFGLGAFFLGPYANRPKPLVLELDGITITFDFIGDVVHVAKILIEEYNLLKINSQGYLEVTLGEKPPEESEELYLADRKMLTNITQLLNNLHLIVRFRDIEGVIQGSYSQGLLSDLIRLEGLWSKEKAAAKKGIDRRDAGVPSPVTEGRQALIPIDPYNFESMKQVFNLPVQDLIHIFGLERAEVLKRQVKIQGRGKSIEYVGEIFELAQLFVKKDILQIDETGRLAPGDRSEKYKEEIIRWADFVTFVLNNLALILQDEVLMRQGFILADGFNADEFDTRFYAAGRLNGLVMYKGWERPIKKR